MSLQHSQGHYLQQMAEKGKLMCWKTFMKCTSDVTAAFIGLGATKDLPAEHSAGLEKWVCQLYAPGTAIVDVGKLRWYLFSKKQLEGSKLPPTKAALNQAIQRAHFQALIWNSDTVACPQLPTPIGYGWALDGTSYKPISTTLPPAPDAIVQLVKCGCKKSSC